MKSKIALIILLTVFFIPANQAFNFIRLTFSFESLVQKSDVILVGNVSRDEKRSLAGVYTIYSTKQIKILKNDLEVNGEIKFAVPKAWTDFEINGGRQLFFLDADFIPEDVPEGVKFIVTAYYAYPYRLQGDDEGTFIVRSCESHPPIIRESSGIYKMNEVQHVGGGCVDRSGYTERLLDLIESAVKAN